MKNNRLRNIATLTGKGERPYVFMVFLLSMVLVPVIIGYVFNLGVVI
jgi:hypothetical protein